MLLLTSRGNLPGHEYTIEIRRLNTQVLQQTGSHMAPQAHTVEHQCLLALKLRSTLTDIIQPDVDRTRDGGGLELARGSGPCSPQK